VVGGVQVLDQDKGHARIVGDRCEHLPDSSEATGRGAYTDHRKAGVVLMIIGCLLIRRNRGFLFRHLLTKKLKSTHPPESVEKLPPSHEDYKNDTGFINAGTFANSIYNF